MSKSYFYLCLCPHFGKYTISYDLDRSIRVSKKEECDDMSIKQLAGNWCCPHLCIVLQVEYANAIYAVENARHKGFPSCKANVHKMISI